MWRGRARAFELRVVDLMVAHRGYSQCTKSTNAIHPDRNVVLKSRHFLFQLLGIDPNDVSPPHNKK